MSRIKWRRCRGSNLESNGAIATATARDESLSFTKTKTEVFTIFQVFHAMVQTQFSTKIQILHSDNGGEFINHQFQTYFQHHGLVHETLCS